MTDLAETPAKRKVLGLKTTIPAKEETPVEFRRTKFVPRERAFFMVYGEGSEMPKRLYAPDELHKALYHARQLTQEHGSPFHVMRSWRAFEVAE